MTDLFDKAIVQKRNVLNELRNNNMTLQELRLFSIYLSKINPRDKSSRAVRFPLEDFRLIMGIGADMNIHHFRTAIRGILQKIVEVPNENGVGYTAFQLFKRARVERDENGVWYVELNAHDDALPLMFDFKDRYFKYELWNALRLKSPNQVRMYGSKSEKISFRKGAGTDDISGDHNEYTKTADVKINGLTVTLRGHKSKVYGAVWCDGTDSYSFYVKKGVSAKTAKKLAAALIAENSR